jgi:quercetin dioxygenase-like cupin family protein
MRAPAEPTVLIDDRRSRITQWRFAPGAATGWHRHELDYIVVPLTTGRLELVDAAGQVTTAELTAGRPYARAAGVEHDVINANAFEFVFLEIELK